MCTSLRVLLHFSSLHFLYMSHTFTHSHSRSLCHAGRDSRGLNYELENLPRSPQLPLLLHDHRSFSWHLSHSVQVFSPPLHLNPLILSHHPLEPLARVVLVHCPRYSSSSPLKNCNCTFSSSFSHVVRNTPHPRGHRKESSSSNDQPLFPEGLSTAN